MTRAAPVDIPIGPGIQQRVWYKAPPAAAQLKDCCPIFRTPELGGRGIRRGGHQARAYIAAARSMIIAENTACATTAPFTVAVPSNRQTGPRRRCFTTRTRI